MRDGSSRHPIGVFRIRTIGLCLVSMAIVTIIYVSPAVADPHCHQDERPHLLVLTKMGEIVVALDAEAAPEAVGRLVTLVREPSPTPGATGAEPGEYGGGHYDGLTFDQVVPHVEIVTAGRPSEDSITIETQIDARVLGLDQQRITDAGEAMDIAQMELAPAYKNGLETGSPTPLLTEWMQRLYETHDAGFLVGTSRQRINEALGYVYQTGLRSLPVTRGSVLLKPIAPTLSSPRLSFVLVDMPRRTGKWMVVGNVIEGLEVVQAISTRPLADPAIARRKDRPLDPVEIVSIRLDCR